jgi:hypothetical protein
MLAYGKLISLFTLLFFSQPAFSQVDPTYINEVKAYIKHIDSLLDSYQEVEQPVTVSLSHADGEYTEWIKGELKHVGGFGIRMMGNLPFDTVFYIDYGGGRNDAYVTQKYYFRKDELVFAEMTVKRWEDQFKKPYKKIQYYLDNRAVFTATENKMPETKDKALIVSSLYKEGMKYLNDFITENRKRANNQR